MSLSPAAQRAIEWLEQQVTDLAGIRNATARDPIFKNWRQATLTVLQRIWPGDQPRLERFLRIPFSPVDPRADLRVMREWYSRGCQEAIRVLNGYMSEIRANGVPEQQAQESATDSTSAEFAVDFPTVDLPSGDLGAAPPLEIDASNTLAEFVDSAPQARDANLPAPPALHRVEGRTGAKPSQGPRDPEGGSPGPRRGPPALPRSESVSPPPSNAPPPSPSPSRTVEKGQGMMAKLKELLGLMQGPAKASTPPRESPSREMKAPSGSPSREMKRPTESPSREMRIPRVPVESPSREMRRPESLRQRSARDIQEGDLPPAEFPSLDLPPGAPATPARDLDIVALGDPVTPGAKSSSSAPGAGSRKPPSGAAANDPRLDDDAKRAGGSWPLPRNVAPEAQDEREQEASPPADVPPARPAAGSPDSAPGAAPTSTPGAPADDAGAARREAGMSVVMSRPTTLRGTIGKVSIESLLSEQFRGTSSPSQPSSAAPTPERPAATPPPAQPPAAQSPATASGAGPYGASNEPPDHSSASSEPEDEFLPGAPVEELLSGSPSALAPRPPDIQANVPRDPERPAPEPRSNVVPLPVEPRSERTAGPGRRDPGREPTAADPEAVADIVDPEAIARATESFMRSSPVLGATGRKVKRERDTSEYEDPDAIAVASMVEDLGRMGVPTGRHSETRARLLDVARRIEKGELEWPVLKKAVWFAMDYPELARRLVPILLPWFERAA